VHHDWLYMASTMVDSLSTLWIMGLYSEFDEAKQWIGANLKFDGDAYVSFFEVNIRILGGLISAYDLSGDSVFLKKAVELGDIMFESFNSPDGFPHSKYNFAKRTGKYRRAPVYVTSYGFVYENSEFSVAEFGTLQLEFTALSERTGNPKYQKAVDALIEKLNDAWDSEELFPTDFHPRGTFSKHWSWAGGSDSFYEYLLKGYLQTKSQLKLQMYSASVTAAFDLLLKSDDEGNLFLAEVSKDTVIPKMDHLTCFAPGMLLLGAPHDLLNDSVKVTSIAEKLMKTCYLMYSSSKTGLSSETVWFEDTLTYPAISETFYALRPEVLESLFYFYYFTGDTKYQEWAWEIFNAIETYCKAQYGYAEIRNVNVLFSYKQDTQQSFFLAETLLYLYLVFSDPIPLDLNNWVLNTEAHPLKLVKR